MQSLSVVISDAAITRHSTDAGIGELRDQRHPLAFRFHNSRQKGTWYLVRYEKRKKIRHRLGYWPTLKTKDAVAMVADRLQRLNRSEVVSADKFDTVGELLAWYRDRCQAEKFKALSRKRAIKSHMDCHLIPKLGSIRLCDLDKKLIDEKLFLPLQAESLKASTIKHMFYTLKPAFKRAADLGYITTNPMLGIVFGEHVTKRIKPKEAKLHVSDRDQVIEQLFNQPNPLRMFLLFMIMFGTRIGETRNLQWSHIQLKERRIVIPAELTKTEDSHVLPITDAVFELLTEYQQQFGSRSGNLFEHKGYPLTAGQGQKWVRQAGKGNWSAHDLRKFARSSWAELGIDYWVGERLLNHKPKGLDAVYIKAGAIDVKLAALNVYHNWLFSCRPSTGTDTQGKAA